MIQLNFFAVFLIVACQFTAAQTKLPTPTKQQLVWQDDAFYLFAHFGPNTFTGKEWGHGDEPEDLFNPSALDCRQWCRIAKAAGAKGIIITAKHHDGFCLWPSKYSKHTVRESKWKNGKGDVLKELSLACKEYGLKFGVYISPWDRNHPDYGTPQYNTVFVNMMTELFTNYGPITELWWDGANGEGPNGKQQVYDWKLFKSTVRKLSPTTVIFSDVGPDIRWVGNENGIAGSTNWNTLNIDGFTAGAGAPSTDTLNAGNVNGTYWIPAECDVSIRPGWFYHQEENEKVKTAEQLFQLYLKSVGRGANLLLNVPPDHRGLFHPADSAALIGFKQLRTENFKNNLLQRATIHVVSGDSIRPTKNNQPYLIKQKQLNHESITIHFQSTTPVNCIVLKEWIQEGQSVEQFYIQIRNAHELKSYMYTTIGHQRIISFPTINADDITIHIVAAKKDVKIGALKAYLINENLIEQ